MAWVTAIGSNPAQIDYRLGVQHGCVGEGMNDTQFGYHTDHRERPLFWVGKALADLGIEAGSELTDDQHDMARALVNGYHPRTGEQLIKHKLGVPRDAKLQLAPLVRMIEGVANEAGVTVDEVLTSLRLRAMFARAQRAVDREGETALLRADHAGTLADAAGLSVDEIWGQDSYAEAASKLTKTITVTNSDGTQTEQVVDNRVVVGNLAYDVTLTLQGSYSAVRGLVDEDVGAELDAIYTEQALNLFGWLEDTTAYGMRGHHGDGQTAETTPGNGFAGWAMIHRAARPVDGAPIGDPHWHVHFTIANMTKGEDGKWSTVAAGGRDLMRHVPIVDKLLQAAVRDVLTKRYQVSFRRSERTGLWEIASIPDEVIRLFSKRGQGIEAALVEMGFTPNEASAALRRVAESTTRRAKGEATAAPDSSLRDYWRNEMIEAGFDPDIGLGPHPEGVTVGARPTLEELVSRLQDVEAGLTAHTRRFSRADALAAVADALPAGGAVAEIEKLTDQVLARAGFVELTKKAAEDQQQQPTNTRAQLGASHMANATLYTTQDILDAEQIIVTAATASRDRQTGILVTRASAELAASTVEAVGDFDLSAEQRRELLRIVTSGCAVDALIGGPGAGKTTLMDAVRLAYQTEGFVIAGAATQGTTAQNLEAESGIPSRTVAQWLWRIDHGRGLSGVDVLVLDEAGMTNDRDRAKLYTAAAQAGAKILEIGDPKQLRGVGCGSMFGVVHAIVEGGSLLDNRRQADADERAAIAAWRRGDYSEALTSWADRDRLIVTETGQEATAAMLATWLDQRDGAPNPFVELRGLLMVAATNEMVDRLNTGAQALRHTRGELGNDHTYELPGGRTLRLHQNDCILVRINDRDTEDGPDVLNGYRGIVNTIHPDGRVTVQWQRLTLAGRITEQATLAPDFVAKGGLTLGYAITIHKSQGMTVGSDGATWYGPDGQQRGGAALFHNAGADNPGSLVASSRHKLAMWMFLARQQVEGHQDEYLLGIPKSTFERTRRVITKLIDRAKATEINANDRPTMVDLGLLNDPNPRPLLAQPQAAGRQARSWEEAREHAERRRAFRAKRHAADVVRRAKAEILLREQWGEHDAVHRVTHAAAFPAVAHWLDRIDKSGKDQRLILRSIHPDDLVEDNVRDPAKLAAALIKQAALAEPGTVPVRRPMSKAERRTRLAAAELTQRDQAADLLREIWGEHPAVERVVAGSAFGAFAQNLAASATACHDPRAVLNNINPSVLIRPGIENPSAFAASLVRAATTAPDPDHARPASSISARPDELSPPPRQAPTRLDVLVPFYERTVTQFTAHPAPANAGAEPSSPAASTPQPPPVRTDAIWPRWLPTPPAADALAGRDRAIVAVMAADARRIRTRVVELGRQAANERPDWVQQFGPAPTGAAQRARYLAAITTIAAYREQHRITGPDPLGPPPPAEHGRAAYDVAQRARDQLVRTTVPAEPNARSSAVDRTEGRTTTARPTDERARTTAALADARRRAEHSATEQRQRTQQQHHDPRRPAPGQGPRPGV
jgi:conjugative relaxase-like TrwC/TraI family protein